LTRLHSAHNVPPFDRWKPQAGELPVRRAAHNVISK
jgi:hypothetical protein